MSVLVIGLSHRSAPLPVLEAVALGPAEIADLDRALVACAHVAEAAVLATCNRLEVYAEVATFHGAVAEITRELARATGVPRDELTAHLVVHYEEAAVAHLFSVACGLESMALGERQILGQVRTSLATAQESITPGGPLGLLLRHALHVGKRVHSETDLDHAGHSLMDAGLARAVEVLGSLETVDALVVGAGAMSALAVAGLAKAGVASVRVTNRTPERAERLAASVGGTTVPFDSFASALADADLVLSCTGAPRPVVELAWARAAWQARGGAAQVYLDLALPRDVAAEVAGLSGIVVEDLASLGAHLAQDPAAVDLAGVRAVIAEEVTAFLAGRRAALVAPTVVALRSRAEAVVSAELARLEARLGTVDERVRTEVAQTVHRVVDKLLHTPTVRVKELAGAAPNGSYAQALRDLFDLPADHPEALGAELRGTAVIGVVRENEAVRTPRYRPVNLRVATRGSRLALAQARAIGERIAARDGVGVELVEVTTAGDVSRRPLATMGGRGVFVAAVREALLDRGSELDLAVHSLKDLPTTPYPGLVVAAVPAREDPRDALVARDGLCLADLPPGSRVGTGSPRRAALLRALDPSLEVVGIRGNVDTRLRLVADGRLDAVVVAHAGLIRLGRADEATEVLDPARMMPAPGQGALALECRDGDEAVLARLAAVDDPATRTAVTAERALLAALEAGCSAPLGAHAELVEGAEGTSLVLHAVVASVDGHPVLRHSASALLGSEPWTAQAQILGAGLAAELLAAGAGKLVVRQDAGLTQAPISILVQGSEQ